MLLFCAYLTAINDLRKVKKEVSSISNWRELGLNLDLSANLLDEIEQDESKVRGRMGAVLSNWLKQQGIDKAKKPTWHQLVAAVEPIDYALSLEIEQNHPN